MPRGTQDNAVTEELSTQTDDGQVYEDDEEEQHFIRLDRRRLPEELSRLEKEDKEFANVWHSRIGDHSARRYRPILQEQQVELEELRKQARWAKYDKMPNEEIERRFQEDDAFARDWTEYTHYNPQEAEVRKERAVATNLLQKIYDDARRLGASEELIAEYNQQLSAGRYNTNEFGRPVSHWSQGLERLRDDLISAVEDSRSARVTPDEEEEEEERPSRPAPRRQVAQQPRVNPALLEGGPDLTPSNGAGMRRRPRFRTQVEAASLFNEGRITADEYRTAKATLPFQ